MTPALVLGSDGVRMAVGASGGRRITNCVTQLISKVIDFGMAPQEAIDSPRVDCSLPVTSVDPRLPSDVVAELEARGHRIYVIGDNHVQGGFASFASPVAIVRGRGVRLPRRRGHVPLSLRGGAVTSAFTMPTHTLIRHSGVAGIQGGTLTTPELPPLSLTEGYSGCWDQPAASAEHSRRVRIRRLYAVEDRVL